jgi:YidC/Oxa1 family membrane protein insertase
VGQIGYLFNLIFTFPIFNALMVFDRLFGNFGLAIVVLTLVVKLILFPLTLQQLKAMKATQALQPQMAEIKRKYPKDQKAQLEAQQALYKEYGMNPLAGNCLPLLIQMPVLFGLFYALSAVLHNAKNVAEINQLLYPFIPPFTHMPNLMMNWFAWINPAWQYPLNLPDPTHILPILAAVATYFQLRMSQQRNATTTDQMAQQMKIMQLISPAMVLFFGWTYAAGLALYWTVSSVFAMVQQYFVTGWGAAFTLPDFISGGNKNKDKNASNGNNTKAKAVDRGKETKPVAQPEADRVVESGPVGRKLQTSPSYNGDGSAGNRSGSSSARRRSASARRRSSNNVPKRNASRS